MMMEQVHIKACRCMCVCMWDTMQRSREKCPVEKNSTNTVLDIPLTTPLTPNVLGWRSRCKPTLVLGISRHSTTRKTKAVAHNATQHSSTVT
jgi:hypothetical protein